MDCKTGVPIRQASAPARRRALTALAVLSLCGAFCTADTGRRSHTNAAWAVTRPLDLSSASSLSRHIARERASGKTVPGILEVTAYRLALRAYPNDRVDPKAHADAMDQRDRMPSTPRRFRDPTVGLGLLGLGPAWQSLGPYNLDPYYQIYMGPYRLSGRVNAAAFEPFATDSIWVCASRGGVWKTDNLGLTWSSMSAGWATQQTSSIAVCPTNGYIIYVGTGSFEDSGVYPDGIYKTVNGGASWTRIGIPAMFGLAISAITVDPDDVNIVMASAGRGPKWTGGVWRSDDAGQTWTQGLNTPAAWSDLKYGVSAGSWRYYYAVCLGNSPEIWRSNDRGLSWTKVPLPFDPQFEDSLRIAPSAVKPERVYLLSVRQKRIWRSHDAGSHWSDITRNFGDQCAQAAFNAYLMCTSRSSTSGPRDVLYAGALSTWVCLDPAVALPSWQDLGRAYGNDALMHADQHCMAIAPYNPNRMLIGNDGGAYLVHFDPATNGWTVADPTNAGLTTIMANRIAVAQTDPFRLLCGNQDNANSLCRGTLSVWETRFSGDGSGVAIHPTNADIQYCTAQGIGILQTRDDWSSQTNISPDTGSDRKGPFTHLALDPSDPDLLYTGTNFMWRWNDRETTWDARLGNTELAPVNSIITAIAVAPSSGVHIYAGSSRGDLWVSSNSGDHWTHVSGGSPPLPQRAITSVAVDPTDPTHVFITIGGAGPGHVFRCQDVLASPRVWTDLSGSGTTALPSAHTNCVALDPDFPTDTLYAATDIGVFTTLDGGAHWSNATSPLGLPNVEVTDLKVACGHLYAATYGRGLWRIPLVAKAVQMTWPNGFEALPAASHQVVRWEYDGPETGRINLDLMKDGEVLIRIAENVPAWHEEFDWTVPEDVPLESDYAIRAVTLDEAPSSDASDGSFGIVEAERISVTAPNGGETLSLGQPTEIRWAHTGALGSNVRVELIRDGDLVQTIAAKTPIGPKEGMAYPWTVPTNLTPGPGYTVRIGSVDKPDVHDASDASFSVAGADTLTITDPNGGELWAPGSAQTIRWAFTGRPGDNVSLALLKSGHHVLDIVRSTPVGSSEKGSYDWVVDPGLAPGVDYSIKIASTTKPDIQDASNSLFAIGVNATELAVLGVDAEHAGPVTLGASLRETDGDPIAGRTVAFEVNGSPAGEAQTDGSGNAQLPITLSPDLTPGIWPLRASFAGDGSYAAATSDAACTVRRSATTLAVPSASGTVGAHAEASATLTRSRDGAPLAGARVTFRLDGADIGNGSTDAAGEANCMFRVRENEGPGERVLEAAYDGDSVNEPSAGFGTFVVALSPTVVRPADAVGPMGSTLTLSADLVRTADGLPLSGRLLRFEIEASHIGDATTGPNGVAALNFQVPDALAPTEHPLLVAFAGDTGHLASSGTAVVDIVPADTTLYAIDRTGTITGLVILRQFDLKRTTDNVLLEGKTISYKIDGTEVGTGTTTAGGDSSLNWIITDGPATRTILAEFAGDASYNGCSDDATLTCETHATKMHGVDREGKITAYRILKAWLYRMDNSPVAGKGIAFKLDGTLLGTDHTRSTGLAQIGYTIADGAGAGTRTILAEWTGDGGYLPSSCTNTLTVLKATPYIWVMPRSVPQGGVARLYAYFRRLADYQKQDGKTVTFRIDGTWVADVVTLSGAEAGIARYNYTTIEPPGTHTIRCEFAGDAWVDAGYGEGNLTVY